MFELHKVGERTYYVEAPTNMGIYRYGEKEVCMIDGGSDSAAAREALSRIEEQGWTLKLVLNTHSHADHSGGCAYLKEQTGCEVYAPKTEASIITSSLLNPTYLYGGYPMSELRTKFLYMQPCECGALSAEILPKGIEYVMLNGHSFEMAAFKTSDDVWFIADAVMSVETLTKYKISFLYDIAEHLRSLERLKTLEGKLFIPSHSKPLEDVTELADYNRRSVIEVADSIKELCRGGISLDGLLEKLFQLYNIRLYLTQYALVGCTTRSYLAWLYERNEVRPVFEGTSLTWKTVE
ncbi:MAG: MBL fold metallo-hydrolase [Oscillospiraceae bacterium]|nr:MBL fold metallo-hydrolase [Oscillospiraceae bacterium]